MLPFPPLPSPVSLSAKLLNLLLQREDWARARLAAHAGKTVRFVAGAQSLAFSIQHDGLLTAQGTQAGQAQVLPDVTLTVPAARLRELPAALKTRDAAALAGLMHVQGDAALAQVVSDLARDLRWDAEDDLARLVGDIPAVRLVQAGRALAGGLQSAGSRLLGNVGEYLSQESQWLAPRPALDQWQGEFTVLQQRLDRLEQRIARLGDATTPRQPHARRPQ